MGESQLLQIGQVAALAGVSVDTVRYYERQGLLVPAPRSDGNFRMFTAEAAERIRFIKQAQEIGLSLNEIRMLLPAGRAGMAECRQVRDLLDAKLAEIDSRLAEMRRFRRRLASYLAECERALAQKDRDDCPVLFELSHAKTATRPAEKRPRKKERQ